MVTFGISLCSSISFCYINTQLHEALRNKVLNNLGKIGDNIQMATYKHIPLLLMPLCSCHHSKSTLKTNCTRIALYIELHWCIAITLSVYQHSGQQIWTKNWSNKACKWPRCEKSQCSSTCLWCAAQLDWYNHQLSLKHPQQQVLRLECSE